MKHHQPRFRSASTAVRIAFVAFIGICSGPAGATTDVSGDVSGPRPLWLVPTAKFFRAAQDISGASGPSGAELTSGAEFGLRLISETSADLRLRFGLDLRQSLGRADGQDTFGVYATRLGARADFHPSESWRLGLVWFFGDTIVVRHHDRQYNGSRLAISGGWRVGPQLVNLEIDFGEFREGPGFITLSRRPGDEKLIVRSIGIGAEWPLAFETPAWLRR